jgi:hypothetical protein
MKSRDIAIGVIVLVLLAGLVYYRRTNQKPVETVPVAQSTEKTLEDKMKIEIPENVDKAELKDSSGGNSTAIATRDFSNGKFASSVIADLPAPGVGEFYQAWLVKGETGKDGYSLLSLGRLRTAKGGFLLDYTTAKDYSDHGKVQVTLEKKADNTPEKVVLEGSF